MGTATEIVWTDSTWNPTVGCTKVSAGCDHCYAETLVNRFAGHNKGFPNRFDEMLIRGDRTLLLPLSKKWAAPRRIFVNSLSDLFHDALPVEAIARVFAVMALAPQHDFQLLTKRHARMRALLNSEDFQQAVWDEWEQLAVERGHMAKTPHEGTLPLPNVWLGVSVENQQWADIRIPALLDTPAAVRFLSCEPLLGPVDLSAWLSTGLCEACEADMEAPMCNDCYRAFTHRLGWVIVGGESGPGARPMHPDWARSLRDQCVEAGVPFLFKQWGEWAPGMLDVRRSVGIDRNGHALPDFNVDESQGHTIVTHIGKKAAGRELDGRTWDEYPATVTA